jgi:hypothetical protein
MCGEAHESAPEKLFEGRALARKIPTLSPEFNAIRDEH